MDEYFEKDKEYYNFLIKNLVYCENTHSVALSLDEEIYEKYKLHCEKNSIILSRKVEKFMEEELKKSEAKK